MGGVFGDYSTIYEAWALAAVGIACGAIIAAGVLSAAVDFARWMVGEVVKFFR